MIIRTATEKDLDIISELEQLCFPIKEAATREIFKQRLKYYSNHFLLLFDNGKLISFIDGFVTDIKDLTDEMYDNASMNNENGKWQMIFGVNTLHEYRNKGYASLLIEEMIKEAKKQKRKGLVLTCKKHLIEFYSKFGFINEEISQSTHGEVEWYQMRLTFKKKIKD